MIYKYCDTKTAILMIKNNFLKFSEPNKFNDPYEACISIKDFNVRNFSKLYDNRTKIKNLYENYKKSGLYSNWEDFLVKIEDDTFRSCILASEAPYINKWMDDFPNMVSSIFAITCFSINPTSILMWAHYAEKFYGCVLGFNYDECPEYNHLLQKVQYRNKPFNISAKYCYGHQNNKLLAKALITKCKDWSYEKEKRLIIPIAYLSKIDNANGSMFGLLNCNEHIKEIIVGNRCNSKELIHLLSQLSNKSNVPFKYGLLKANEYEVSIKESV